MNTVTILETGSLLILCVNITPSTEKMFFFLQFVSANIGLELSEICTVVKYAFG